MTATDQDTTVGVSAHERRVRGLSNWVRDFPIGQGGINEFELEQLYGMLPHTDPAAASSLLDQLGDQLLIMANHDERDMLYREASERFDSLVEDAVSEDETTAGQERRRLAVAVAAAAYYCRQAIEQAESTIMRTPLADPRKVLRLLATGQEAPVLTQPPHPTKWTVHVEGPDDLHYYDTEASARTVADNLNAEVATWPKDEFTPTVRAVVIPPDSIGRAS